MLHMVGWNPKVQPLKRKVRKTVLRSSFIILRFRAVETVWKKTFNGSSAGTQVKYHNYDNLRSTSCDTLFLDALAFYPVDEITKGQMIDWKVYDYFPVVLHLIIWKVDVECIRQAGF